MLRRGGLVLPLTEALTTAHIDCVRQSARLPRSFPHSCCSISVGVPHWPKVRAQSTRLYLFVRADCTFVPSSWHTFRVAWRVVTVPPEMRCPMEVPTRVVMYGSSLHLAGIAASLKAQPDLEVVFVDPRVPGACQRVKELNPAVVTFDLSRTHPGLDVILLCEQLGLLLIGAEPNSNELLVISRLSMQAPRMADLVTIIRNRDEKPEPLEGHGV